VNNLQDALWWLYLAVGFATFFRAIYHMDRGNMTRGEEALMFVSSIMIAVFWLPIGLSRWAIDWRK